MYLVSHISYNEADLVNILGLSIHWYCQNIDIVNIWWLTEVPGPCVVLAGDLSVLYCTVLYCTVLYCTPVPQPGWRWEVEYAEAEESLTIQPGTTFPPLSHSSQCGVVAGSNGRPGRCHVTVGGVYWSVVSRQAGWCSQWAPHTQGELWESGRCQRVI